MLHVVPPIVLALAKSPAVGGATICRVRKLFSGAAPLGADVIAQCTARVGCVLQQGYGMTEASPATHTTSDDPAMIKPGSIGVPVANTECRVVDPATGADVRPGTGRRALGPRTAGDAAATSIGRRRRARRWTPTAGCTPATSATPTRTATSSSSIG